MSTKVFTLSEKAKLKDSWRYSESWEVTFEIQKVDGFWGRGSIIYYTEEKYMHEQVEKRFKADHIGQNVKLIRIIYQ